MMINISKSISQVVMLASVAAILMWPFCAQAQIADLRMSRPQQHVSDSAGALDAATARRLENILVNLQQRSDINFVVVTIKTVVDKDLFDCSVDLANEWDIGSATSRQKSLLMLIASDNGKFYTQTSPAAQNL